MTELPTVRIPGPDEEDAIMVLCRAIHGEIGLFSFSEEKVRNQLRRCWSRQGTIIGVIGPKDNLQASTCLVISDYYYTNDWHLAELWNYVLTPYRRSRNAEALIEFGKKCSDEIGVPYITGIITNDRVIEKVRLYRRRLGMPAGAFFVHNGAWVRGAPTMEDVQKTYGTLFSKRQATNGHLDVQGQ
jgi:hypothetical protein